MKNTLQEMFVGLLVAAKGTAFWVAKVATKVLVVAILIAIVVNAFGIPYVRTKYTYREAAGTRTILFATYSNPFGSFQAMPSELGRSTCPLIIMQPVEMSFGEQCQTLWRLIN